MKCNIIGAGRLGKNIALALSTTHLISDVTLCNRRMENTLQACQELGFGQAVATIEQLPAADIIWIGCNDDAISHIVEQLMQHALLKTGCLVIHSSGVSNATLLAPLRTRGCFVASLHPLKAFKTNYLDPAAFNQVDCVLEGDEEACTWLQRAFTHLGAYVSTINPQHKAIYHAAACMASNYLISLAACSEELFLEAGISPQQSRRMLINLMQGNITNLKQTASIAESLTGPLMRGDLHTLTLHLNAIKNTDTLGLYKAAGLATLPLTQVTTKQQEAIKNLFAK